MKRERKELLLSIWYIIRLAGWYSIRLAIARSRRKSLEEMVNIISDRIKDPKKVIISTRNAMCKEDEEYMIEKLKEKLNYEGEIYSGTLGAVIGAHSGPGAIGIGFTELEE